MTPQDEQLLFRRVEKIAEAVHGTSSLVVFSTIFTTIAAFVLAIAIATANSYGHDVRALCQTSDNPICATKWRVTKPE